MGWHELHLFVGQATVVFPRTATQPVRRSGVRPSARPRPCLVFCRQCWWRSAPGACWSLPRPRRRARKGFRISRELGRRTAPQGAPAPPRARNLRGNQRCSKCLPAKASPVCHAVGGGRQTSAAWRLPKAGRARAAGPFGDLPRNASVAGGLAGNHVLAAGVGQIVACQMSGDGQSAPARGEIGGGKIHHVEGRKTLGVCRGEAASLSAGEPPQSEHPRNNPTYCP